MWPLLAAAGNALAAKAGSAAAGAAAKGAAATAAKSAAASVASQAATEAATGAAASGATGGASGAGLGATAAPVGGGIGGGGGLKPSMPTMPKPSLKPQLPAGTVMPPMPGGGGGGAMEPIANAGPAPNTQPLPAHTPTAAQQVGFFDNLLNSTTKQIGRTLGVENVSAGELLTSSGRSGLMRGAAVNQFDNLLGGRLTTGLRSMGLPDSMNAGDMFRLMSAQQQPKRRQPGQP